ncbi:hypothetical protein R4P64_15365 [Rhodococcus sp. IEGM 1366]|uniref:hypothetical protein n=1 Tax=unclassified Rhodococcus (in: high G+C Gram-positive bacteria) TaxID=192944 RepID=UPI001141F665|nr:MULTISPECIES: hypothetical protein [unclassified Rhodococcus (in: high G+C Gram-positive bacteria)]MDV8067891.1 hypothetical protein [Rhodococcus sp. IEGM 1366]ROZ46234.1 hypothetical protein EEB13_18700 [Rhodococcus sp. WS3]RZL24985.1 MAG: hypothetical protein EOP31_11820 [Rhodococcus sp. (in: high G+C Gram-positive bacteria)]
MADLCSPTFDQLATELGFSCAEAGGLVEIRNPFGLENWTLPVLEWTIIIGSVLALVLAIVRLRRNGDPTNLVLWFGATAYLFIIEPPLYFPAAFGIEKHVDTMFAHNVFTVDFLWGRLPLYIIAIYPLMATLAFEIVKMLGVFRRYGVLAGAVCVGFVHHAFYEIFDHLGPQLRWWEWSTANPINQPMFDAVPLPSVVVFAALWPMSLAFCVQFFVGRHVDDGQHFTGLQLVWRTIVIGVLASVGTFILPLPATVFGAGSDTVRGVLYAAELVILSVVAITLLIRQWTRLRTQPSDAPPYTNRFVQYYSVVYLCIMAVLWASALPDFFGAVDGSTSNGDPIGNLWYTLACFVVAILCVAATFTVTRRSAAAGDSPSTEEQPAPHTA